LILYGSDGELVGRIERGLRGSQCPGTDAGILLGEEGRGCDQAEEEDYANCGFVIDGINVADGISGPGWYACNYSGPHLHILS
jgi:hypothetical protein